MCILFSPCLTLPDEPDTQSPLPSSLTSKHTIHKLPPSLPLPISPFYPQIPIHHPSPTTVLHHFHKHFTVPIPTANRTPSDPKTPKLSLTLLLPPSNLQTSPHVYPTSMARASHHLTIFRSHPRLSPYFHPPPNANNTKTIPNAINQYNPIPLHPLSTHQIPPNHTLSSPPLEQQLPPEKRPARAPLIGTDIPLAKPSHHLSPDPLQTVSYRTHSFLNRSVSPLVPCYHPVY